ncbi:outer membrane protein [Martelella endophytica]|uniref:Outer membrane protein beta-barrel domain-containing protein n=1 Tax=Martelella endophytica TaxID=1486262 RepID=A0A0D5LRP2_MAREN|nr:outer membrane beta-barrel protein [Martelella endophytica]AJY46620.1 hypothetical protein TM49_14545 [Martelella endophytica]
MKLFCVCVSTLFVLSGHSFANDLTSATPETNSYTWSGFYVGAQGGYQTTQSFPDTNRIVSQEMKAEGGQLGGFAGFNHQFANQLVLGLEASFYYADGQEDQTFTATYRRWTLTGKGSFALGWGGVLQARAGRAFGRTLVYATAGGEVASGELSGSVAAISMDTDPKPFLGWTVGAGVERALTDHVFARLEYRYAEFPETDCSFSWDRDFSLRSRRNVMQVGLGYRF